MVIGGHKIDVKIADISECGRFHRDKDVIVIASDLSQTQRESTFFHEIIHSINSELSEVVVDSLAEQLYSVLKGNKMLKDNEKKPLK